MTVLTATDIADRHRYLATAWPEWRRSMAYIKKAGGPWKCPMSHVSYLCYRCSVCGKDLASSDEH